MLSFLFIRAPLELYSETWSIDYARKVQLFKCDQIINVHTYQSDSFETTDADLQVLTKPSHRWNKK